MSVEQWLNYDQHVKTEKLGEKPAPVTLRPSMSLEVTWN
jgi:hypothetical protein